VQAREQPNRTDSSFGLGEKPDEDEEMRRMWWRKCWRRRKIDD
jgi:hypothetical protein